MATAGQRHPAHARHTPESSPESFFRTGLREEALPQSPQTNFLPVASDHFSDFTDSRAGVWALSSWRSAKAALVVLAFQSISFRSSSFEQFLRVLFVCFCAVLVKDVVDP